MALYKHLKYIHAKKLWKEFGEGKGTNVLVIDSGEHGDYVMEIIRRVAPLTTIFFKDWIQNNLTILPEVLEETYKEHMAGIYKYDVINMALSSGDTPRLKKIIKNLYEAKVVLIASSGNKGFADNGSYPADYLEYVTSVGSIYMKTKKVSPFTVKPFETLAPGEDIDWIPGYGTSWACPHIAGMAACFLSKVQPFNIEAKVVKWMKEINEKKN